MHKSIVLHKNKSVKCQISDIQLYLLTNFLVMVYHDKLNPPGRHHWKEKEASRSSSTPKGILPPGAIAAQLMSNNGQQHQEQKPSYFQSTAIQRKEHLPQQEKMPYLQSESIQRMKAYQEDEKKTAMLKSNLLQQRAKENSMANHNSSPENQGNTLHEGIRAKMENSFGQDFSDVTIHTSSQQATSLNALAYTQGSTIHFAPGQYDPSSQKGQELIGHELAHVVQQKQGRVQPTNQLKGMNINSSTTLEREADNWGSKAARGEKIMTPWSSHSSGYAVQMKPEGKSHVVQSGESPFKIASMYQIDADKLLAANGFRLSENPDDIHKGVIINTATGERTYLMPGQVLTIPGEKTQAQPKDTANDTPTTPLKSNPADRTLQVGVEFNAFICNSMKSKIGSDADGYWFPEPSPFSSKYFKGDNRNFLESSFKDINAKTSRIKQYGEVTLKKGSADNIKTGSKVGESHNADPDYDYIPNPGFMPHRDFSQPYLKVLKGVKNIQSLQAPDKGATSYTKSTSQTGVTFDLRGEASYPFSSVAPDIDFHVTIELALNADGSLVATLKGQRNDFPAYEAVIFINGQPYELYRYGIGNGFYTSGPGLFNLNSSTDLGTQITKFIIK